jgi:hypothetical protein
MGVRYGIWANDIGDDSIDTVIPDIGMGYGLMIWEIPGDGSIDTAILEIDMGYLVTLAGGSTPSLAAPVFSPPNVILPFSKALTFGYQLRTPLIRVWKRI